MRTRPVQSIPGIVRPLLAVLILVLAVSCAATPAEEQDKDWTEAEPLIDTSDRIVSALFLDSTLETVQLVDSSNGTILGETDVLLRQFEVFETFKGTIDPGDTIWVAFEPGREGELINGISEVMKFSETESYVLFLKGRLRPLEYPSDIGGILWTGNGEPSFALLVGTSLEFYANRTYLELLDRSDGSLPNPRSASPFIVTLDDLRGG